MSDGPGDGAGAGSGAGGSAGIRTKRVLVLGGTGFLGARAVAALGAEPSLKVRFTTRRAAGAPSPSASPAGTDPAPIRIENLKNLDLSEALQADVILDTVSAGRGRLSHRRDILERIGGHARLIDALANGAWRGHYVFLSSGGIVYGLSPPAICTEDTPLAPFSDYALEKAFVEMHLSSIAPQTGMTLTILRPANAYGEDQPAIPGFGVIPALVDALATDGPFKLYGKGESRRDYIHADDVVAAILAVVRRGAGGVFNVASGRTASVRELVALAQELSGRRVRLDPVAPFAAEPLSVTLDPSRAAEELGWRAEVDLREGIRRVLARHGLIGPSAGR